MGNICIADYCPDCKDPLLLPAHLSSAHQTPVHMHVGLSPGL